jgi:hypothetical protein
MPVILVHCVEEPIEPRQTDATTLDTVTWLESGSSFQVFLQLGSGFTPHSTVAVLGPRTT